MTDPPVIREGAQQVIGSLVVEMTTAKNIPEQLLATHKLAAHTDGYVNLYLREIDPDAPTILQIRSGLQAELEVAQDNEPEDPVEWEDWRVYIEGVEYQLEHVGEAWSNRTTYKIFIDKWDALFADWNHLVSGREVMVEGGLARVFEGAPNPARRVYLPVAGEGRTVLLAAMGLADYGQEVILNHAAIMRGTAELDRRLMAGAGTMQAVFAEIYGDFSVYQENYYQHLALHRADQKGKLSEALEEQRMRRGMGEFE